MPSAEAHASCDLAGSTDRETTPEFGEPEGPRVVAVTTRVLSTPRLRGISQDGGASASRHLGASLRLPGPRPALCASPKGCRAGCLQLPPPASTGLARRPAPPLGLPASAVAFPVEVQADLGQPSIASSRSSSATGRWAAAAAAAAAPATSSCSSSCSCCSRAGVPSSPAVQAGAAPLSQGRGSSKDSVKSIGEEGALADARRVDWDEVFSRTLRDHAPKASSPGGQSLPSSPSRKPPARDQCSWAEATRSPKQPPCIKPPGGGALDALLEAASIAAAEPKLEQRGGGASHLQSRPRPHSASGNVSRAWPEQQARPLQPGGLGELTSWASKAAMAPRPSPVEPLSEIFNRLLDRPPAKLQNCSEPKQLQPKDRPELHQQQQSVEPQQQVRPVPGQLFRASKSGQAAACLLEAAEEQLLPVPPELCPTQQAMDAVEKPFLTLEIPSLQDDRGDREAGIADAEAFLAPHLRDRAGQDRQGQGKNKILSSLGSQRAVALEAAATDAALHTEITEARSKSPTAAGAAAVASPDSGGIGGSLLGSMLEAMEVAVARADAALYGAGPQYTEGVREKNEDEMLASIHTQRLPPRPQPSPPLIFDSAAPSHVGPEAVKAMCEVSATASPLPTLAGSPPALGVAGTPGAQKAVADFGAAAMPDTTDSASVVSSARGPRPHPQASQEEQSHEGSPGADPRSLAQFFLQRQKRPPQSRSEQRDSSETEETSSQAPLVPAPRRAPAAKLSRPASQDSLASEVSFWGTGSAAPTSQKQKQPASSSSSSSSAASAQQQRREKAAVAPAAAESCSSGSTGKLSSSTAAAAVKPPVTVPKRSSTSEEAVASTAALSAKVGKTMECALCGKQAPCEAGECFCRECKMRMELLGDSPDSSASSSEDQEDLPPQRASRSGGGRAGLALPPKLPARRARGAPSRSSSGDSRSGSNSSRESRGGAGAGQASCVFCGQRFVCKDDAQSTVLCNRCLAGQQ